MFNRPKKDDAAPEQPAPESAGDTPTETPPLKPFSARGQNTVKQTSASFRPEMPKRALDIPNNARAGGKSSSGSAADSKQLIVGREITLNGEISTCDKLLVEGRVEATLSDGQSMEIAQSGTYKGTAKVAEAVISGTFEGDLEAERCVITNSGLVSGKLKYAVLEIEAGGRVVGTLEMAGVSASSAQS